ncbi:ribulose-phosphate 3-epimerase [Candidatus Woesearchaeota archaeon]|nr:ribulose-phosphate 3-epimerase [Candidatus Woesearchaeota archaeon]
MVRHHIVPAILVKTKKDLMNRLRRAAPYFSRAQIDIIDGRFAKNRTIGANALKNVKTKLKLEIQLMVKNVDKYVEKFLKLKPWMITFPFESCRDAKHINELIKKIKKSKIKVGISINPETPAHKIKPFLKKIDLALVMTIHPGFSGQPFLPETVPKIRHIRKWDRKIDLEVDGGIHVGTACITAKAGANVFVAGGAIYKAKDIKTGLKQLRKDAKCMT